MTAVARSAANTMAPANPTRKPIKRQYALSGLSRPSPTVSITFSAMISKAGASNPCNTVTYCSSIFPLTITHEVGTRFRELRLNCIYGLNGGAHHSCGV